MEFEESVKWIDDRIFAKTGKRLDSLQISILEATLRGQKYPQIAAEYKFSTDHVRKAGWKLWKLLSDMLGEPVSQSNFRALVQQGAFANSNNNIVNSNNNINGSRDCSEVTKARSPASPQPAQETPTELHIDLGDAPEIFNFYGCTNELATLQQWIINDESKSGDRLPSPTRIAAILEISGIGKTTLAMGLIDIIKTQFNYVIYRSLRFSPTLETTLTNLLQIFSDSSEITHNIETQISKLFNHLRQYRILIILDDVQALFSSGQLAGQYRSGYEDYQLFFQQITEVPHHSCLILISSEKPREIAELEKFNLPLRTLVLGSLGMAAKDILSCHQLLNEEAWETLINTYEGNPLWLNITATLIRELFGGRVADFLQYDMPILDESLCWRLEQQLQCLSEQEVAVIVQLAKEKEAVALSQMLNKIKLSPSDLIKAMKSLVRRFLLAPQEQVKTTVFTLNPVVAQYVKTRHFP
ncbi:MAG: ATPase [Hormoscilla sp. SP5CHS1]|nr:ATPase [Hormoscilla sp. SP12CHS1]MBC6455884.1 ATPase [Hormoscilla sp. SP5CHS1]